jgi:hypothetical protein
MRSLEIFRKYAKGALLNLVKFPRWAGERMPDVDALAEKTKRTAGNCLRYRHSFKNRSVRNDQDKGKMRKRLFLHLVISRLVISRFLQDLDISNIVLAL